MTRSTNSGKRAQVQRSSVTVKDMIGSAESEIARHQAELAQLIEAGRVDTAFSARVMERQVFEGWQSVQDRADPTGAFVELCRVWYREIKQEEDLMAAHRRHHPSDDVALATAYLEERMTKPSRADIAKAVERGELTPSAGCLAYHTWEITVRNRAISARQEARARARVEELMERLRALVRPGKVDQVREIIEAEIMRRHA